MTLLYQAILFRYPDSGAAGWIDQVQRGGFNGLIASAQGIADSYEFHGQVTSRYNATQIVINAYRVLINRYPDPGANNWVGLISQSRSGQAFSGIVGSDAFRRLHNL